MSAELAWLIGLGFLLGYEVYALVNRVPNDTLSEAFWRAALRRPLVPFLLGMLCGHFVWMSDRCAEILK